MKQNELVRNTAYCVNFSPHDREIVLQCTEQITRTIQQLCNSIQEPDKEECVPSAERVKLSIVRLASHLPKVSEITSKILHYQMFVNPFISKILSSRVETIKINV